MKFEANHIYHIYNRGNNKQTIFFNEQNYLFFLTKIKKELSPLCSILAYCLMPNHFHLLIYVNDEGCKYTRQTTQSGQTSNGQSIQILARKVGTLLSSYTRAINKQNNRTGSLFQQKTKAKSLLNNDHFYPITCFHYIHQNPVKSKLVTKMEDWEYSSFRDYVGIRKGKLPNIKLANEVLGLTQNKEELYKESYQVVLDKPIQYLTV